MIPGQGAKIPHALWPQIQNLKQKQYGDRFKKDFKTGPHKKKKKSLEKCIDCRRPEGNLTKRQVTLRYYPARKAECFRESEHPPVTLKFTPHLGYVTERSVNVV